MNQDRNQHTKSFLNGAAIPLTIIILCIGCAIGGQIIRAIGPWLFGPQNWDTPPGAGTIAVAIAWTLAFLFYSWLVNKFLNMS